MRLDLGEPVPRSRNYLPARGRPQAETRRIRCARAENPIRQVRADVGGGRWFGSGCNG